MAKTVTGYVLQRSDGTGLNGIDITVKDRTGSTVSGGSANPTTTDADGRFTWSRQLSPGPISVTADIGASEVEITYGESQHQVGSTWVADILALGKVLTDGVFDGIDNELSVSATGTRVLRCATGMAVVDGYVWDIDTQVDTTGSENVTLANRHDRLVLRQYVSGDDIGMQEYVLVEGTVTDVDPDINNVADTVDLELARGILPNGGTSYTVTDRRAFTRVEGTAPLASPTFTGTVTAATITASGTITGNALVATTTVTGADLVATDDLTVGDDAAITGDATVGGTLGVTGNTTVGGTLGVTGNTTTTGSLDVLVDDGQALTVAKADGTLVAFVDTTPTGYGLRIRADSDIALTVGSEDGTVRFAVDGTTGAVTTDSTVNANAVVTTGDITAGDDLIATDDVFVGDDLVMTSGSIVYFGTAGVSSPSIRIGTGDPEGGVAAAEGSIFLRTDGTASTTLYVKHGGGVSSTGWVAIA